MTVRAVKDHPNLLEALTFYGPGRKTEAQNMRRVEEVLDYLELWGAPTQQDYGASTGDSSPRRLARSLVLEPDVLLLDEAMSGLTFDEKYDMIRFITDLYEEEEITIVMIEHDLEVVTDVSDRMLVLQKGGIIARGPPDAGRRGSGGPTRLHGS